MHTKPSASRRGSLTRNATTTHDWLRQRAKYRPLVGLAMVEAVIMLPVFTIIFFGVMYVKDVVMAGHQALTEARECSWTYSKRGCDELPAGCTQREPGQGSQNTPDDIFSAFTREPVDDTPEPNYLAQTRDNMQDQMNGLHGSNEDNPKKKKKKGLLEKVKKVVMDSVMKVADAFGNDKADLYATRTVTPPSIVGKTRVVGISYRLACNTVPKTIFDVFKDMFAPVNPF